MFRIPHSALLVSYDPGSSHRPGKLQLTGSLTTGLLRRMRPTAIPGPCELNSELNSAHILLAQTLFLFPTPRNAIACPHSRTKMTPCDVKGVEPQGPRASRPMLRLLHPLAPILTDLNCRDGPKLLAPKYQASSQNLKIQKSRLGPLPPG